MGSYPNPYGQPRQIDVIRQRAKNRTYGTLGAAAVDSVVPGLGTMMRGAAPMAGAVGGMARNAATALIPGGNVIVPAARAAMSAYGQRAKNRTYGTLGAAAVDSVVPGLGTMMRAAMSAYGQPAQVRPAAQPTNRPAGQPMNPTTTMPERQPVAQPVTPRGVMGDVRMADAQPQSQAMQRIYAIESEIRERQARLINARRMGGFDRSQLDTEANSILQLRGERDMLARGTAPVREPLSPQENAGRIRTSDEQIFKSLVNSGNGDVASRYMDARGPIPERAARYAELGEAATASSARRAEMDRGRRRAELDRGLAAGDRRIADRGFEEEMRSRAMDLQRTQMQSAIRQASGAAPETPEQRAADARANADIARSEAETDEIRARTENLRDPRSPVAAGRRVERDATMLAEMGQGDPAQFASRTENVLKSLEPSMSSIRDGIVSGNFWGGASEATKVTRELHSLLDTLGEMRGAGSEQAKGMANVIESKLRDYLGDRDQFGTQQLNMSSPLVSAIPKNERSRIRAAQMLNAALARTMLIQGKQLSRGQLDLLESMTNQTGE